MDLPLCIINQNFCSLIQPLDTISDLQRCPLLTMGHQCYQVQISACQIFQAESLTAIFPPMSEYDARCALLGSADRALDALSSNEPNHLVQDSSVEISVEDKLSSASFILTELRKQMIHLPQKLMVNKEDLLSEAICYYKDPNFDPRIRIRICSDDQVALDTGGVSRQFFSDVFAALSQNHGSMTVFQGEPKRRLPFFKSEHFMSSVFEIIGKKIAHSLGKEWQLFFMSQQLMCVILLLQRLLKG